jgi:hypothetical protein
MARYRSSTLNSQGTACQPEKCFLGQGLRLLSRSVHGRAAQRLKLSTTFGSGARAQVVVRLSHVGMYQRRAVCTCLLATVPDQGKEFPRFDCFWRQHCLLYSSTTNKHVGNREPHLADTMGTRSDREVLFRLLY